MIIAQINKAPTSKAVTIVMAAIIVTMGAGVIAAATGATTSASAAGFTS
jgi:hypothetical protein